MLKSEWKKAVRRWYFILTIFLFLVGKVIVTYIYAESCRRDAVYERYIYNVEGKLTKAKAEFIEQLSDNLVIADLQLQKLKKEYYVGQVDADEYQKQEAAMRVILSEKKGIEELFNQYVYAREKIEERYLISECGWNALLGNQMPDYLAIGLLILLVIPIYCEEYQFGMDKLLLATKNGGRNLAIIKVIVTLSIAGMVALFGSIAEYLTVKILNGLPKGCFPIQSLQLFYGVEKQLSLEKAYLLSVLVRTLGYMTSAVILLAIAALLKRTAVSLMIGMIILVFPFFSVSDAGKFVGILGPWIGLVSPMILRGTEYEVNPYSGQTILVFRELENRELLLMIAGMLWLIIILSAGIWRLEQNAWLKPRKRNKSRLLIIGAVLGIAISNLLSGCGGMKEKEREEQSKVEYYNTYNARCIETDQVRYYVVNTATSSSILIGEDKESEERWIEAESSDFCFGDLWDQSQLAGLTKGAEYICKDGNDLYYGVMRGRIYSWNGSKSDRNWMLVQLNTDTGEEKIIYEVSLCGWRQELSKHGIKNGIQYPIFVAGTDIYAVVDKTVMKIRREGIFENILELEGYCNVACDGTCLYYSDSLGRIKKYHLQQKREETIEGIIAGYWLIQEDGIYFTNKQDQDTLWRWNLETKVSEKLGDVPVESFDWDRRYIFFVDQQHSGYYRLEKENKKVVQITKYQPVIRYVFPDSEQIYVQGMLDDPQAENMLVSINKETLQITYFSID